MLDEIKLSGIKCISKHICQLFLKEIIVPRGKFFWRSKLEDINWLLPDRYCSNRAKEKTFQNAT